MVQLYRNEERVVSNRPCGRPVNDSQSSKEAERGNNVCHTFFCIYQLFYQYPCHFYLLKKWRGQTLTLVKPEEENEMEKGLTVACSALTDPLNAFRTMFYRNSNSMLASCIADNFVSCCC